MQAGNANEDQLEDGEEGEDDVVVTTQEEFAPHTWPTPVMGIQEVPALLQGLDLVHLCTVSVRFAVAQLPLLLCW